MKQNPKPDQNQEILPSLLDRLIDLEPANRFEAPAGRAQGLRRLKNALRRDLEWLLNTRRTVHEAPEWAKELPYSLHHYGLPDFTHYSLHSPDDQDRLLRLLEAAIAFYEPRLRGVTVTMQPLVDFTRVLHFQIEGMLQVEPSPERVIFDTRFELSGGGYVVQGEPGA